MFYVIRTRQTCLESMQCFFVLLITFSEVRTVGRDLDHLSGRQGKFDRKDTEPNTRQRGTKFCIRQESLRQSSPFKCAAGF